MVRNMLRVFLVLTWPLHRRCVSLCLLEDVIGPASHPAFGSLFQLKWISIYSRMDSEWL